MPSTACTLANALRKPRISKDGAPVFGITVIGARLLNRILLE